MTASAPRSALRRRRSPRAPGRIPRTLLLGALLLGGVLNGEAEPGHRSPREIVAAPDGSALYLVEATAHQVAVVDPATGTTDRHIDLPGSPGGMALSPDGQTLCVTRAEPDGGVWVIDPATGTIRQTITVGHTPVAAAITHDGKTLFVCNQFDHDISVVDLAAGQERSRIAVRREPVAVALSPDGRQLVVANLLPVGPANGPTSAAEVSVIDPANPANVRHLALPNGSHSVQGVSISPDGRYAYLTHILSRYQVPTTQLERGWMNTNALSILDLADGSMYTTVLLDDVDRGAANPWALAMSADGHTLCVTHAGTHELSIIQREAMHDKLRRLQRGERTTGAAQHLGDVPNDLAFLTGVRTRVPLLSRGPRGVAVHGQTAYVTGYFSDSLSMVSLDPAASPSPRQIPLAPPLEMDRVRRGEFLFHDAARCFQQWQSCASCHPGVRADALNWDLLNDGIGNPKNTKSMLLAHRTPPAMISGVRDRAETAVRAGIRHIQFAVWPEEDAAAMDQYLRSLTPVPSPSLVDGRPSDAAQRGGQVFAEVGCITCHPPPLYTDLALHEMHSGIGQDSGRAWDTPTLVETWRTAPYLHDGRSATLEDLLVREKHGLPETIPPEVLEHMDDLIEYVRTL